MKVSYISTYNIKCGIATYSDFLISELGKITNIKIFPLKKPASSNPFYWIGLALKSFNQGNIIHIQFNYELFGAKPFWTLVNSFFFFNTLFFLRMFKAKPIVMTFHENFSDTRKLVRSSDKIYRRTQAIIVHTEETKVAFQKRGYKNIFLIPHGVFNRPVFLSPRNCQKKLHLEGKIILTMYGFINPFKNYEFILNLLPKLPQNYFLLIAGSCRIKEDEIYFNKIKNLVEKLPQKAKISGFLEDKEIPLVFNATDIFLFPYTRTTQSGALAQTMAYQKPCIVSALPAFLEINKKYSCLEVAQGEKDWTDKIKKIAEDSIYRNNLIKKIARYYKENNWQSVAEMHKKIYEKIISQN